MSSDDAPVATSAPDPAEKPHHRGPWARIGIGVGSSVTYQIMCLSVAAAMGFVDVSWESTALALLGLLLLGHVLWAFVLRGLIRPPRRRDRLAAMLVCTPALVLAGWLVAWDRAIGPIPLGWIIATTVPAAFG
jgi:hypothetical protein